MSEDGGFIGGLVAGALLLGLGFALGKSMSEDGGFIGGLVAGALLLGLGFALGKSSKKLGPRKRFHRSWSRRHMNPGWRARREGRRRRKIDREILAYLREARELMREISNGNPKAAPLIDVEFVVPSGTANETAGAEPGAPEVKK